MTGEVFTLGVVCGENNSQSEPIRLLWEPIRVSVRACQAVLRGVSLCRFSCSDPLGHAEECR